MIKANVTGTGAHYTASKKTSNKHGSKCKNKRRRDRTAIETMMTIFESCLSGNVEGFPPKNMLFTTTFINLSPKSLAYYSAVVLCFIVVYISFVYIDEGVDFLVCIVYI